MKKMILAAACLTLVFAACKKSDDNGGGVGSQQFKIGPNTYTALAVVGTGSGLGAIATGGNSLSINFPGTTLPTASGSYTIVSGTPTGTQLSFGAIKDTSDFYSPSLATAGTATVTVDGGKVSVSFENIWAKNITNANDSLQISANLKQTL
jgi:hypothetical protein